MSAHLNASHTATRQTAGPTVDNGKHIIGTIPCVLNSTSFDIAPSGDLLNQAALPPHHQAQTYIDPRHLDGGRFLELPCQYPWNAGSEFNMLTAVENWDFVTAVQPGLAPRNQHYQAGTQQEAIPWNGFAVPGVMTPLNRPGNSPVEGLSYVQLTTKQQYPSPVRLGELHGQTNLQ
ncbi:uncharacterized protein BO87DRAFT_389162 [Aspergillus neoniger CBS 115656]|uniref:Uncharacterized protein n=1 Tax=Aspergillus neoniger (strain CBS 115656) TaxID=1448310 RepID=A0A318YC85_ASPNB|nr:hypothetical protein BO87DRAFT_389162 [Aspergillus neoniger CBS 115656]PYH31594.1 hypothetical protein BO87DRAFT_389162 [Aspergillus neoniger CBS 115656]